jgi:hypothetical protein
VCCPEWLVRHAFNPLGLQLQATCPIVIAGTTNVSAPSNVKIMYVRLSEQDHARRTTTMCFYIYVYQALGIGAAQAVCTRMPKNVYEDQLNAGQRTLRNFRLPIGLVVYIRTLHRMQIV